MDRVFRGVAEVAQRRHRHQLAVEVDQQRVLIFVRVGVEVLQQQPHRRLRRHVIELRRRRRPGLLGGEDLLTTLLDLVYAALPQRALLGVAHAVVEEVRQRVRVRVGVRVVGVLFGPVDVDPRLDVVWHVVVARRVPFRHAARVVVDVRDDGVAVEHLVGVRTIRLVPPEARLGDQCVRRPGRGCGSRGR